MYSDHWEGKSSCKKSQPAGARERKQRKVRDGNHFPALTVNGSLAQVRSVSNDPNRFPTNLDISSLVSASLN